MLLTRKRTGPNHPCQHEYIFKLLILLTVNHTKYNKTFIIIFVSFQNICCWHLHTCLYTAPMAFGHSCPKTQKGCKKGRAHKHIMTIEYQTHK